MRTDPGHLIDFGAVHNFLRRVNVNIPHTIVVSSLFYDMMVGWWKWVAKLHAQHNRLLDIYSVHQQLDRELIEATATIPPETAWEDVATRDLVAELGAMRRANKDDLHIVYQHLTMHFKSMTRAQSSIIRVKRSFIKDFLPLLLIVKTKSRAVRAEELEAAAWAFYPHLSDLIPKFAKAAVNADMTVAEIRKALETPVIVPPSATPAASSATRTTIDLTQERSQEHSPGVSVISPINARLHRASHARGIQTIGNMPPPTANPYEMASPQAHNNSVVMLEKQRQEQRARSHETSNPAQDHLPLKCSTPATTPTPTMPIHFEKPHCRTPSQQLMPPPPMFISKGKLPPVGDFGRKY